MYEPHAFVCDNKVSRSGVGLLLLDSSRVLIYINELAIQLLSYPQLPVEAAPLKKHLLDKIQLLLPSGESTLPVKFTSGRRQYSCNIQSVTPSSGTPNNAIAVLLERKPSRSVDIEQAATKFRLSQRERETVTYLLQGLTSKEIAKQMTISPYTVKTYLKLIMIKMTVSTRSGIVGKLVSNEVMT
jgi:DNA-binding CsgD family transcriptional regulator